MNATISGTVGVGYARCSTDEQDVPWAGAALVLVAVVVFSSIVSVSLFLMVRR